MNRWIDHLAEDDLAFLKRFALASGSLKKTAKAYGISYPTVRLRLDRLIQKLEILDDESVRSPFERHLRLALADGKLGPRTFQTLLDSHRDALDPSARRRAS